MRSILRQIVAVLALVGITTSMVPATFAVTYTAQAAADKLAASGFIVDQSATPAAYRLADNLLRQEAVGTAAKVLGLLTVPLDQYVCQNKFSDVTAASGWVCRAAELAANAGLTNAANATFRPKDNLTRFEALVFALRAAGLVPSEGLTQAALIQLGVDNGLITSSAGFNANAAATRGEFFQYVVRGLDAAETPELCDILGICPTPTPTPTPTSGTVSAMIGNGNPASGTLVAGQAIANLAHFAFVNNSTSDVKVTNVKVNRIGVSADETLVNTYLYDGVSRITDAASVSTGLITFNDATGLFTIPAKSTKVVAVRSDIKTGTSGQTVGVSLSSFTVMGGTAQAVSIAGNIHTVATASLATVDFNTTTTPATTTITPQEDYTMWQNVVSVGVREVWLRSFKLRQVGSVNLNDLANFRLYVDGQQVGGAVANLDSNGYVTFDLSTPLKLQTGSRTIKMLGTIVNGSSRNFSFSLRQASDAMFVDDQYNVVVLPTAASSTFSARSTGTQTIDSGSLTFTKTTNSPSGDTVKDASGVVLARYEVKAYGESMKVENLSVAVVESDSDTAFTLRNGALFLDGAQIGSTASIAATTDSTLGYTNFTFGSSFIVTPGTTRILEIRADLYDNDGSNGVDADDTLTARVVAGSTNVQRLTSLGYGSYPAALVAGNQLTVKTGSLTVAEDTSTADKTVVPSKTGLLIAKYNIQASTSEGSNITSVTVDPTNSSTDAFDASDDLTNMYIKVGNYTSPVKSTVDDNSNVFSTNINIAAGQTVSVEVYADIATGATDSDGTADTGTTTVDVAYTTLSSATSTTSGAITGQTMTYGSGKFTTAVDGSSPVARSVSGNQVVTAAAYKFTATNESYTIKEVTLKVRSAAISSVTSSVQLYDGATPVGAPVSFSQASNTEALITGLNVTVPSNTVKVLTAKYTLNNIGTGAGASQSNAILTLESFKFADSQGVEKTAGEDVALASWTEGTADNTLTAGETITITVADAYAYSVGGIYKIYKTGTFTTESTMTVASIASSTSITATVGAAVSISDAADGLTISGAVANHLYVYKAVPTVAQVAVDTTTKLVNGTARDLYKVTISAPSSTVSANGIAVKQIRLPVTWNDGGAAGDALEVESLKLILDGSDITSSDVTIQDQAGNTVESTSGLVEADSYVIISWDSTKELSVGAGQTRTLTLRGTPQGFNVIDATTTPTDSVGFSLQADASHNGTSVYLNGAAAGAADDTVWGLYTSATTTDNGVVQNFIWSDLSANPHATAENASSSADWANSYKIYDDFNVSQFNN